MNNKLTYTIITLKPTTCLKVDKMDERAQLSAEMILLIGAILVIVIVAGSFIFDITDSIAGNITQVIDTARDNTINRM